MTNGSYTNAGHDSLPPIQSGPLMSQESSHSRQQSRHHSIAGSDGSFMTAPQSLQQYATPAPGRSLTPPGDVRQYLTSSEEVLFMQVFVEEVGLWMDSMDPLKHFSRILPFYALNNPILLNAFLACGARHLTLVNPAYHEDRALFYYDTATTTLLRCLQNPDRHTHICVIAAVILNVYEIMSEREMQHTNHIESRFACPPPPYKVL